MNDDSTIMYTANPNSAGCQTWASKPKRVAALRKATVTSHAPTISSEIGAT